MSKVRSFSLVQVVSAEHPVVKDATGPPPAYEWIPTGRSNPNRAEADATALEDAKRGDRPPHAPLNVVMRMYAGVGNVMAEDFRNREVHLQRCALHAAHRAELCGVLPPLSVEIFALLVGQAHESHA